MSTPMFDMPEHFAIGVDANGSGPVDETDDDYDHTMCWCADDDCEMWRET